MQRVVFFDFDKTLSSYSWSKLSRLFLKTLLSPKAYVWQRIKLTLTLPYLLWLNYYQHDRLMPAVLKSFAPFSKTKLQEISETVLQPVLWHHLYHDAMNALAAHKKAGDHVVILTGNLEVFLRPIAERLKVNALISTKLQQQGDYYLPKVHGESMVKQHKRLAAEEYLKQFKEPVEVIAYGDSHNDIPILEFADHAVCVNPGKKLTRVAQANGWSIEAWSEEEVLGANDPFPNDANGSALCPTLRFS